MSAEVEKLERHLEALKTFMGSPAYLGYQDGLNEDIRRNEREQVDMPMDDFRNLVELMQLKGEHRCLTDRLAVFEDARVNLKRLIDETVEKELQNAGETHK